MASLPANHDRDLQPICPSCGSTNVEVEQVDVSSALEGTRFAPGRFTCRDCGGRASTVTASPLAENLRLLRLVIRGEIEAVEGDLPLWQATSGGVLAEVPDLPARAPFAPTDVPHVDVVEHLRDGRIRRTLWGLP